MNKREKMYKRIEKHGNDLNAIFNTGLDPVTLCKKLFSLENKAHTLAEQWCNGDINAYEHNQKEEQILIRLTNIIGMHDFIFINSDPRGYALKIKDKYVRDHNLNIYKDWGGYGIIAPDMKEDN